MIEEPETWKTNRVEPEISLEWKDLRIDIKYCGNDLPDEVHEFVELFPNLSDKVPCSNSIMEKKVAQKRKMKDAEQVRPESRSSNASCHTLTQVLEQNKMVNKRRSDGSSTVFSPEPEEEMTMEDREEEEIDDKSQKSEDMELPDNIDQLIDVKKLIKLEDGSQKCHICLKVFSDTTRMKRHLLSHSDKKPFKCHLCGWGFHQKTNMERHLASHTKEGEGHPCTYCNSWFTTKSVVSLHIRDAHQGRPATKTSRYEDDGNYTPHKTPENHVKKLTKPDTIVQPTVGDDDLSNLKCNICGKTFVKKTNLKHHLMLHRGEKPWKCHICGWRFVQKCNLKKHIETHSSGTYKCPHCDIKFASKGAVSGHIDLVHSLKPNPIILNADVVVNPEEDEEEIEIPAPEEPVKQKSGQSTPSNNWWNHIEANSEPENKMVAGSKTVPQKKTALNIPKVPSLPRLEQILKTFPCKTCSKVFTSKKELDNHVLVHNAGMKPFACPICGLRFHLIHNMKRHLQTHEESGDIEQGTAAGLLEAVEATATKAQSSVDQPVTTNANGYLKCNLCKKWFAEEAALRRHMEVHSEKRPHACPICGWRFKQLHNMKRHLMTHSGAKPYSCDFCDKSYTDNYSLKQHVAKIHPDVASSLPHMMITPRTKNKPQEAPIVDDEGFKSMVNEMTTSQKAAALQAYRESLSSPDEHLPFGVEAVTYDDEEHLNDVLDMNPSDFMEEGNIEITSEDEAEIAEYANEDIGENVENNETEPTVETLENIADPYEGNSEINLEEQGLLDEEDVIIPTENLEDAHDIAEIEDMSESTAAEEGSGTTGLVKQNEDLLNEIVEPYCLTDKVNDIEMGNTDE